jgi:hypothetical protein
MPKKQTRIVLPKGSFKVTKLDKTSSLADIEQLKARVASLEEKVERIEQFLEQHES